MRITANALAVWNARVIEEDKGFGVGPKDCTISIQRPEMKEKQAHERSPMNRGLDLNRGNKGWYGFPARRPFNAIIGALRREKSRVPPAVSRRSYYTAQKVGYGPTLRRDRPCNSYKGAKVKKE